MFEQYNQKEPDIIDYKDWSNYGKWHDLNCRKKIKPKMRGYRNIRKLL